MKTASRRVFLGANLGFGHCRRLHNILQRSGSRGELAFARDVSDRVLFMEKGRIVEQGPPSMIFSAPQNERTRSFLREILER
jgi:ABC-type phosphonate transport system ATPase subunit